MRQRIRVPDVLALRMGGKAVDRDDHVAVVDTAHTAVHAAALAGIHIVAVVDIVRIFHLAFDLCFDDPCCAPPFVLRTSVARPYIY